MKTVNSDMKYKAHFNRRITFDNVGEIEIFDNRFINCEFVFTGDIVKFDNCIFDYTLPGNGKFKLINCDYLPEGKYE